MEVENMKDLCKYVNGLPSGSASQAADNGQSVAYIPARCNSTRVKDKNVADLCGHPLLAYTIRMALAMEGIDRVFVDTDSERYAAVAREYGASVPFLRGQEYADDTASLAQACQHFFNRIKVELGEQVRRSVVMLPTSPFRNLDRMNELLRDLDSHVSVRTICMSNMDLHSCFVRENQGCIPLSSVITYPLHHYKWFKEIGCFQGHNLALENDPSAMNVYNNYKYALIRNPIELVDIDLPADLQLARRIVAAGLYEFGVDLP